MSPTWFAILNMLVVFGIFWVINSLPIAIFYYYPSRRIGSISAKG
jgi:hypothetical protein